MQQSNRTLAATATNAKPTIATMTGVHTNEPHDESTSSPSSTSPNSSSSHDDSPQQSESVLMKILELEELDTNMYRGYSPRSPRWGRIYGGQTVAQALVASCRTVDQQFIVHSLHSYFLRPGADTLPIIYYVERLRNGKSFASRRVTALQKGQAIFSMNVSFQRPEKGLEHQDPMPDVPPPESLKSLMDTYREMLADPRLSNRVRVGLQRSLSLPFPMDFRRIIPASLEQRLQRNPPRQLSWMRVQGSLSDSPMLHQCALAYLSDWSLLEAALLPHGLHGWMQNPDGATLQMASIDHTIYFHHPFRADDWLLYDIHSNAASGGRGLSFGKIFDKHGKLIVSTVQEGLIRVHKPIKHEHASKHDTRQQQQQQRAIASKTTSASTSSQPPLLKSKL